MEELKENATSTQQQGQAPLQQTIIVQQEQKGSNGLGVAGFVLALIAFLTCWIPVMNFILWCLGTIFSFIGVFKRPRGLAIAGLVISFIDLIVLIAAFGILVACFA